MGILIFWGKFDTFKFVELWRLSAEEVSRNGGEYPFWMTVGGLFLIGGTVGKSAQFPLHIWLPDAMEGPTPVSAMIHAATMVAAGVFLLGRTFPMLSPEVLGVLATVGAFTALFAATIGTTVNDIKGVLAYSTISQLGFMVAAVGCGGVVAGMFHMVTHAFFKSCLFLSAGSVIHGCHHNQDMRWMGGLKKFMPLTFIAMLVSTLAIAGVPFFSGFYSKDMVVMAAFEGLSESFSGSRLFASIALPAAACLTAFYMFRLIFLSFYGEFRGDQMPADEHHGHDAHEGGDDEHGHAHGDHGHGHTPHESPRPMTVSLICLALLGFLGGNFWLVGLFGDGNWYPKSGSIDRMYGSGVDELYKANDEVVPYNRTASAGIIENVPHLRKEQLAMAGLAKEAAGEDYHTFAEPMHDAVALKHSAHTWAMGVSLTVAGSGILLAWLIYRRRVWEPAMITARLGVVYTLVRDKYYIDEAVNKTVIAGTMWLSKAQSWIDRNVVDGVVNAVGKTGKGLGFFSAWIDKRLVDGFVNGLALLSQTVGALIRVFQTGRIQQYATFAVAGGLFLAAWLILS